MNRKKIIVSSVIICIAAAIYFGLFFKNKTLKYIPANADVIVLVDVKKMTRQYISEMIMHPSGWFNDDKELKRSISLRDSGLKVPDFIQVFHIKNTGFSEWYSVVEIDDKEKVLSFLKEKKFLAKGKNVFQKDRFFVKINGNQCILGSSDSAFSNIGQFLAHFSEKNAYHADQLINDAVGSISYVSGKNIQNFSITLNGDNIEIKSTAENGIFNPLIAALQKEKHFLSAELNAENVKHYTCFFDKNLAKSAPVQYAHITADLEQVNDTIISYGYDDNFNEVEKQGYQKIIQPNYIIAMQFAQPEKLKQYFLHKKWINAENQFTGIPFQPNIVAKTKNEIIIRSTRNPIALSRKQNQNYIFIKNNVLLSPSLNFLNNSERKTISNIEYIFYGNREKDYYVKIQFREDKLPLILTMVK
ncbi:hypothetical protein N0B16_08275 [Chryseobacterium sp. GMJ5]|uniref:DUF4340 domain-containing protein n=1 Tax=Chryseobacterium gilvum TaxID=2976534 RepID=A0ABT2VWR8_9FLAO|nr:hypothetical protein [Chryseobacterium gilvum]MCU7614433.1 hypothetical protein [Chryseobacterium gilvum]